MFAGIADHKNNYRVFVQIARQAQSCRAICAARAAAKNSFHSPKLTRSLEGIAIADVHNFVDILHMRVGGQDFLANALDQIRRRLGNFPGLFIGFINRAERIGANDFDIRVLLFQESSGPGNRAAGADTRNKVSDLSLALLPKLRACGAIVRLRISRMRILIGIKGIRCFRGNPPGGRNIMIGCARLR